MKELVLTKLSFDTRENARVFKQMRMNLAYSTTLQVLHLIGIHIRADGWESIA